MKTNVMGVCGNSEKPFLAFSPIDLQRCFFKNSNQQSQFMISMEKIDKDHKYFIQKLSLYF